MCIRDRSKAVLKNATSWLKQYNKSHEVSLDNEKWYWQQIRDTAVKGSTAYKQATSQPVSYTHLYLGNDRSDTRMYLDLYRKKVFRMTLEGSDLAVE